MISLKLQKHLKSRDLNILKNKCIIDEETDEVYFLIWNLSGQLIGFQKYFLDGEKVHDPNKAAKLGITVKYFTYMSKINNKTQIGVYGLKTYKFELPYLFITEGIFDIIKIHNCGQPGIAMLMNDPPKYTKTWLSTLPQKKIVIYDNDTPGLKLKKLGDYSFNVPAPYKDLGDMPQNEVNDFISNILKKI